MARITILTTIPTDHAMIYPVAMRWRGEKMTAEMAELVAALQAQTVQ